MIMIGILGFLSLPCKALPPIRVGILHSLTGPLAISETGVIDTTQLAIGEWNSKGGLLGRHIQTFVRDGASDAATFADQARYLIEVEKVDVIFGCWTSASRKAVKTVVEDLDHLLFYPVQYEGLETSENVIYIGSSPNQQLIPGAAWARYNLGKKAYLIGSDYIFPHTANEIMKLHLKTIGTEILGTTYISLNSTETSKAVDKIIKAKPDFILNTLNGEANVNFFQKLHEKTTEESKIPVMSFSIGEQEIAVMDAKITEGHYLAASYFSTIPTKENKRFLQKYREYYGSIHINDPMESAYTAVNLWANAVLEANSSKPSHIKKYIPGISYVGPQGTTWVDFRNRHVWKNVRIGHINKNRLIDIIWSSGKSIAPIPFPIHRTKKQWMKFQNTLYHNWGNSWSAP